MLAVMSGGRLTLVGVFALGVLGGAGALRFRDAPSEAEAGRASKARGNRGDDDSAEARDLARLRRDLARLGVKATHGELAARESSNEEGATGQPVAPASAVDASSTEPGGELASELLARLEREYQASRLGAPATPGANGNSTTSGSVADGSVANGNVADVAPAVATAPAPPAAVAAAPALGAATRARAAWTDETAAPAAEPVRVADNRPVIVMGDVNQTNIQQTVNETTLNQVSVVTRYQQLLLVAPGLAGALGVNSPAPSAAPARRPGPSPNDSNPWASTDYSSHYANPWGSPFGRPPAF
jgi:hypothetical protein